MSEQALDFHLQMADDHEQQLFERQQELEKEAPKKGEIKMTNQDAVDAYVLKCHDTLESLARLTEYVEDHGEVAPDEVNWGHVGQMADLAKLVENEVDRIDKKGEFAE